MEEATGEGPHRFVIRCRVIEVAMNTPFPGIVAQAASRPAEPGDETPWLRLE
jgi:hypothetical protein